MAVGAYGITRPADVSPADVEIFYHYVSGRTADIVPDFRKLDSVSILTPVFHTGTTTSDTAAVGNEVLGGLYNLKLTAGDFDKLGIYTLLLRPKQIRTTITDCGVLASLPSVRGLVIDLGNVPAEDMAKFIPQGLVGYRIEYINTDGTNKKIPNFYRLVTSSFYCSPVVVNTNDTTTKSVRYQYSDTTTNYVFLTITPSSAPASRPNVVPYIGVPGQKIILSNTYFNPTTIEIEMVEHDATTLSYALYGNQSKAVAPGIYTIYDSDNNIYKQYNLFEIKDQYNDTLYEIREQKDTIDETLNLTNITNV
jgi:hypothetical protein